MLPTLIADVAPEKLCAPTAEREALPWAQGLDLARAAVPTGGASTRACCKTER